jgi:hypothetical protein
MNKIDQIVLREAPMKAVKLAAGLLQALVLAFSPAVVRQEFTLIPLGVHQEIPPSTTGIAARGIYPVSEGFYIAESGKIKPSSAVAYGGGNYVVLYVTENKDQLESIHAAVISDQDDGPGVYPISNHPQDCGHPAIAYEASSGLFIIVYAHNHKDIYVVVFSPSTETVGPAILISEDEVSKGFSAVACNQLDGVCLVAYQQGGTHIKGRYIDVSSEGIGGLSEIYDLADDIQIDQPHLAWGWGQGTFLLAYNEQLASGEVRPTYTHVFDQDDPQEDEVLLHPSAPVLPGGLFPPGSQAFLTDAAFDPCTEKFVLTIEYDEVGDGDNFDLWGAVVHARDPISGGGFPIANTPADEYGGAIRFITADHVMPTCGAMDLLVAAYINADVGLMAAELRGNSNPTAPGYAVEPVDQHLVLAGHTDMYQLSFVALSSGSPDRQVLVLYERFFPYSEDYEIWGQFLAVSTLTYLPLVVR